MFALEGEIFDIFFDMSAFKLSLKKDKLVTYSIDVRSEPCEKQYDS